MRTSIPVLRGRGELFDSTSDYARMTSLSRSPSPHPNGGWATPGLSTSEDVRGRKDSGKLNGGSDWSATSGKSAQVNAYASFNKGNFVKRHLRQLSASLPRFYVPTGKDYSHKEKLGRGRLHYRIQDITASVWRMVWHFRRMLAVTLVFIFSLILFYNTCE